MTKETETRIASDEDLTRLFAGKPTQYRKSKSLPKFTGEAMRTCATINRIFFDDPDEAYRLFTAAGFRWGGAWRSVKDYQHFEF